MASNDDVEHEEQEEEEEEEPPTVIKRRQSSAGSTSAPSAVPLDLLPRQLSQTHSEPEGSSCDMAGAKHVERSVTWAEPRIKVIPPSGPSARSMLMAMHTEYTRSARLSLMSRRRAIKMFSPKKSTVLAVSLLY